MQFKISLIIAILLVIDSSAYVLSAEPQQITVGEIKKSLACLCDCNMTVEACGGAMTCRSAEKLTAEATQYVEQGMNKAAILAAFVQEYGEHILAAPTKRGFNLTAWILPFAAIIAAGYGIIRVLQLWVRQQQNQRAKVKTAIREGHNSAYEQTLDDVLRHLD